MTLEQAIKSGRKFRRPNMTGNRWYHFNQSGYLVFEQKQCGDMPTCEGLVDIFTKDDFLAEDWELEPEIVSLTKEAIIGAIKKVLEKRNFRYATHYGLETNIPEEAIIAEMSLFFKELGFEND